MAAFVQPNINAFDNIPKIKQDDGSEMTNLEMEKIWNTPGKIPLGHGISGVVYLFNEKAIKKINMNTVIQPNTDEKNVKDIILHQIKTYYDLSMRCSDFVCQFIGYYYNELTNQLYIKSEYCGTELFNMYAIESPEQTIILDHIFQILKIVQCLHNNNFVHRDLKLENFTIDKDGKIRLIDFDTCIYLTDNIGKEVRTAGTKLYLDYELKDTNTITKIIDESSLKSSDIYSLGVLILNMVMRRDYVADLYDIDLYQSLLPEKTKNDERLNRKQDYYERDLDKLILVDRLNVLMFSRKGYIIEFWSEVDNKLKELFGIDGNKMFFFGKSEDRKTIDELVELFEKNIVDKIDTPDNQFHNPKKPKAYKSRPPNSKLKNNSTTKQIQINLKKGGKNKTRRNKKMIGRKK
jgi:serine/threonine protein kinase